MNRIASAKSASGFEPRNTLCPACRAGELYPFYELRGVPANSCLLFDTREAAVDCVKGDIALNFCMRCGFIHNAAFDARKTEYSGRYEETQGFSPTFSRFHRDLAARLIERYDLRGKRILEIGCGKGEFLLLLAELGGCEGVGIDPSARQDRIAAAPGADSVTLITEYYREDHGAQGADAVVCKMTLEHISEPFEFVSTIRRGLDAHPNTVVFFQIPEALRILKRCAFEDIYHEHCSYFTPSSLEGLFRRCGFQVRAVGTEYDEQYLTIEAFPTGKAGQAGAASPDKNLASLDDLVRSFPERVAQAQASWRKLVLDTKSAGQRVLLWGSGSKTVSFMSTLGLGDVIDDVVDVNPYRQGHYMPGSGQRILAPSEIPQFVPDLVIVMNRIYEPEITSCLHGLGCRPRIASL